MYFLNAFTKIIQLVPCKVLQVSWTAYLIKKKISSFLTFPFVFLSIMQSPNKFKIDFTAIESFERKAISQYMLTNTAILVNSHHISRSSVFYQFSKQWCVKSQECWALREKKLLMLAIFHSIVHHSQFTACKTMQSVFHI